MHVVIWTSDERLYATPSHDVVEVIPVVQCEPLPNTEPWIRGTFNYRGRLIALIDVTLWLFGHSRDRRQFTRIVVVETESIADAGPECVGLLVDSVRGSEQLDFGEAQTLESVAASDDRSFLGPIGLFDSRAIQLTDSRQISIPQVKLDAP